MKYDEAVKRFSHHPPTSEVIIDKHERVRQACFNLVSEYKNLLGDSRESSLAYTKLEESMFWANADIARNQNEEVVEIEPEDEDPTHNRCEICMRDNVTVAKDEYNHWIAPDLCHRCNEEKNNG